MCPLLALFGAHHILHVSRIRVKPVPVAARCIRRRSAAARLLRSWVRIPPVAWMFVCCECCVLSGRSLCDELITRPEESYRLWCVVVCYLETSRMRMPWPALGRSYTGGGELVKKSMPALILLFVHILAYNHSALFCWQFCAPIG